MATRKAGDDCKSPGGWETGCRTVVLGVEAREGQIRAPVREQGAEVVTGSDVGTEAESSRESINSQS